MRYWRLCLFERKYFIEYKYRAVEITGQIVMIRNIEWNVQKWAKGVILPTAGIQDILLT